MITKYSIRLALRKLFILLIVLCIILCLNLPCVYRAIKSSDIPVDYKYYIYCEKPEKNHETNGFYAYEDGTITFFDQTEIPTVYTKKNIQPENGTLYYKVKYTRIKDNETLQLLTIPEIVYVSQQNTNLENIIKGL
jgi:hypothetical protein